MSFLRFIARGPRSLLGGEIRLGRRALAIVVVVGAVAAGLTVGDQHAPSPAVVPKLADAAAPVGAGSSAWYCPMVFARRADPAAGSLAITNLGNDPISGVASVHPVGGTAVDAPVNIPGNTRLNFSPGNVVDAELAAVVIRMDGGGVTVEQGVRDGNGESWSPCATEADSLWHTADGSTDAADLKLGLFNPFSDIAIADLAALTDASAGFAEPAEYRGIVVPARSLVVINIGDQVRRRLWIATTTEVRRGRLVVGQLQTGTLRDVPGISLGLASPASAASNVQFMPSGQSSPGITDRLSFYNPGDSEGQATVVVTPEGEEPIRLPTFYVPTRGRIARDLDMDPIIPKDKRSTVSVTSTSGVVTQRTVKAGPPAAATGYSISSGAKPVSNRWLIGSADTTDPFDLTAGLHNNGEATDVRISVIGTGASVPVPNVRLEKGQYLSVHLDDFVVGPDKSVLFEAVDPEADLTVTREIRRAPGATLSTSPAIALR